MHSSRLKVASSKRLKQMRDITVRVAVLFVCGPSVKRLFMHGQYRPLTEQPPVDMKEIYGWLKTANLSAATEGLVVAAQDQAL